ncbi:tetratricopeptide repeat protein [bacterium]|nr:tetratricopeptide repeat protein [bacterium]MBP9807155.1 tetratricopeptide repeat protein [bacterium]
MQSTSKSKTHKSKPVLYMLLSLGVMLWQFTPVSQISPIGPVWAAPSYSQAESEYKSGKYAQALASFQALNAAYPSNVLVHYYLALCHQNLGHMGQAKAEYQLVVASGQPQLAPLAAKGLATLSGARSGSGSASSNSNSSPSSSDTGVKVATAKVKKVLEFWAEW